MNEVLLKRNILFSVLFFIILYLKDKNQMKKVIKWGGIALLIPVSLFVILSILLYLPPIQNFVVGKVTEEASVATGMDIQIKRVSLSFPLDLVVHEATVVHQVDSLAKDTVLDVNKLKVSVQLLPLMHKKVELNGMELLEAKLNTGSLIEGISVKGELGKCYVESHGVDLTPEMAIINQVTLENTNLDISMADTAAVDTTASDTIPWKIKVEKVDFKKVALALSMPLDSIRSSVSLGRAKMRNALVDLKKSSYFLDKIFIREGMAAVTMGMVDADAKGFDPNNIQLSDINLAMDSVYYEGDLVHANIKRFNITEHSGFKVVGTKGKFLANHDRISIPKLEIKTSDSQITMSAKADWPLSKIDKDAPIRANFTAHISKKDIFKFVADLPEDFMKTFPEEPMELEMGIEGSLNQLNLTAFDFAIPQHMNISSHGLFTQILDNKARKVFLEMRGDFPNMNFLKAYLGDVMIPSGTNIDGTAEMKGDTLNTKLVLATTTHGEVNLDAGYTMGCDAYHAKMTIDRLNINAFMPKDSLYHVTASMNARGLGLDFLQPSTWMEMEGKLDLLEYGEDVFHGVDLRAQLRDGKADASLQLNDHHFDIQTLLNAHLSEEAITAEINAAVKKIDFRALGLSEKNFNSSQNIRVKMKTDMDVRHSLRAEIKKNKFTVDKHSFTTKDILFGADLMRDSIKSYANTGDLTFMFQSGNGLDDFLEKLTHATTLAGEQWEKHALNQETIKEVLPDAHLRILAGKENPINSFLKSQSLGFKEFQLRLDASPVTGIESAAHLYELKSDSIMLDSIHFHAEQAGELFRLGTKVKAKQYKNQEGFTVGLDGQVGAKDVKAMVEFYNVKGKLGAQMGAAATFEDDGVIVNVIPKEPTLVYKPFHVNEDNFVSLDNDGRIQANLRLYDETNAGMHLYSTPDSTVHNDLTLLINQVNLAEMRKIVPFMPDMAGLLNIETHYVQPREGESLVSIETMVDSLKYNQEPMGNWSLSAVYLPKENEEHCIDGFITRNKEEIMSLNGSYFSANEENLQDKLNASLYLNRFPLSLSNAFVSRKMAELTGHVNGEMSVSGSTSQPILNGSVLMDKVNVFLPPASMNLRFEEKPITVKNSKLHFNKYKIQTLSDSPFTIDGNVDFADLADMQIDLKMVTDDFELINGKKTKESLVYGKLYIDLATTIKGTPDNLKVRGAANILGKSNFTYILKDSPLTVEDRLNDMVTFVNFNDTVANKKVNKQPLTLGGVDVLMALHIDQAVQGRVDLNDNGSNYMLVEGGGDLSFKYTPEGNMYMNGRYSLLGGEMKYEMPVIPLKTFKIKEGSFIEWTGNVMNPKLNIKAFEKMRSSVSRDGKNSRMVTFNVGVNLTNRLEDLGFTFTLEAPEDGAVQDELAAMSAEEKNKLAVTMLVTGLYIAESNASGGLNANNALNSFLQGQINNIAGSALKTIDLNFGMEKTEQGENGGSGMDYNFQFAKRFWNNRFRIVIGGKISTGNTANQDESFIDNVSLEYRLDNSGTRYVKVFHDRKYANVLEGEIVETGAGIVLRKKVSRVGELFIFKKKKKKDSEEKALSTNSNNDKVQDKKKTDKKTDKKNKKKDKTRDKTKDKKETAPTTMVEG